MSRVLRHLTDDEIVLLYRKLLVYVEGDLAAKRFDVSNRPLEDYLSKNGITLDVVGAHDRRLVDCEASRSHTIGFSFTDSKKGKVMSLFAHLRNSFAHCQVTRKTIGSVTYFCFQDSHREKVTMYGMLPVALLSSFLAALKASEVK